MDHDDWNINAARQRAWADMVSRAEHTFQRKPTWLERHGNYEIRCTRYPYFKELEFVASRDVWIRCYRHSELCAIAHFDEWRVDSSLDIQDFWYAADGVSSQSEVFASIIMESWPDYEPPFDFGNAVHFERLAVNADADRERMALKLINRAIEREFLRRASVLMLCAFPLEFENNEPEEIERASFLLARRKRAMFRRYQSILEMRPFRWGIGRKYGWMWRPLRYCPDPVRQKLAARRRL